MSTGPGPRRLLIYSQDGLGLGHLRRTTLLASEFLAARPDGGVLTICDSPAGQFFAAAHGHDYLKIPSIRKVRPGEWSPVSLSLSFDEVLEMRRSIITAAALGFEPDVLLVDHMPHGAMGELVPTLEALEGSSVRTILGLRDILDAPATIRRRWRLEGAFEAVERHFDEVLVYGSQDVFDLAAQYDWPTPLRQRLHYCGYVCSPEPEASSAPIRRRYVGDNSSSKLIVAMAGGGADAAPLFETLARAVPVIAAEQECVVVLVTGPFLPRPERARLHELAGGLPIQIMPAVADSLGYIGAADLVVAMAGYNTTAEILRLRARALLVPRAGPSAEQQMRASRLAERGLVHYLSPTLLSVESLAQAVLAAMDEPAERVGLSPDLTGVQRAARRLLRGSEAEGRAGADDGAALPVAAVRSSTVAGVPDEC
jgi:predicted glycosyltransferase